MQKIIGSCIIIFSLIFSYLAFKILFITLTQLKVLSILEIMNKTGQFGILAFIAIILLALGISSIQ